MHRTPASVREIAGSVLAGLPTERRELFDVRLAQSWSDLDDGLREVYPEEQATALAEHLVRLAAEAYRDRDADLLRLDLRRMVDPGWLQSPSMLGYAAYVDRFAGDLAGVRAAIPYLQELGVTYLHLMPLLATREGDDDGGYAVSDYRTVHPDLGTMDDLRTLARDLRAAGISLVVDLVLNHVAREHAWAAAARAGDARYRDYFHVLEDRAEVDRWEETLPEVFPDFSPGSFTHDASLDAWVWTTFNSWQWDVNWANPDVFAEYAEIVLFLANAGVEVLRLDAIAFLWKRMGTSSQNQPEVHALTQALRALTRIACPAVAFKAEAIVGPADLVQYLGQGRHHGKVSDLAYHNVLMVHIWSMLAAREVPLAAQALRALPPIPHTAGWVTYLRCHDDIGWAIDDEAAAAVGLSGGAHRAFLSDYYTGTFYGSRARGLVFQHNPATGDRRVSGTAASLAGLELARAEGDPEAVDLAVRRLLLGHTLVLGWGGVPVLWMGDEVALPNDPRWAAEPGHAGDNRWAHRPRMPWSVADRRRRESSVEAQVFSGLAHRAAVRATLPHLHASVAPEVLEVADPGVLPVLRRHPLGPLLALYNVTDRWCPWPAHRVAELGLDEPWDALTGTTVRPAHDGHLWLPPYAAWWLVAEPKTSG